jgi:hypothetical protein
VRHTAALLGLLIVSLGAAPSPAPTTPPTIAHVVARPLCTALRVQVRPVLAGLAINDELTKAAGPILARYYNDRYVLESSRAQFDIAAMRDIATRMAHNLLLIDTVLATLPAPPPSASADDLKVAALRKQFNDVEDAQRATINVIGGLAETQSFTDLQNFSNPLARAIGPESARTPAPTPADTDMSTMTSGTALDSNSMTPFLSTLSARAAAVTTREEKVSESVLAAARDCGAHSASPSPSSRPPASP